MAGVAGRLSAKLGARSRGAMFGGAVLLGVIALLLAWWRTRLADWQRVESWAAEISAAASESGIDPYLLGGLVYSESRGKPDAVSSAAARGLCQLKDATAEEMAAELGVGGGPPYPPAVNLRLGAAYLAKHIERMQGSVELGLLCYRVGPGRVAREIARAGGGERWLAELQAEEGPGLWRYCEQVRGAAEQLRARDREGATRAWRDAARRSSAPRTEAHRAARLEPRTLTPCS